MKRLCTYVYVPVNSTISSILQAYYEAKIRKTLRILGLTQKKKHYAYKKSIQDIFCFTNT